VLLAFVMLRNEASVHNVGNVLGVLRNLRERVGQKVRPTRAKSEALHLAPEGINPCIFSVTF